MRHDLNGPSGVSRRAFLERAACAGALLMVPRAAAAADGMYVSLNGSLTRQMPWPDFARLAAKVGYGGVDVNLGQAKTEGVEATRALFKELNIKPASRTCRCSSRRRTSRRSKPASRNCRRTRSSQPPSG